MKKYLIILLMCVMAGFVQAVLIDDFEDGTLTEYTSTVILDANGGGSNTASWQIANGELQLNTTAYDGIEQYAMIFNGLSLPVHAELQVDISRTTDSQDIGLYVGGTTPVTGTRQDYVAMYARNDGNVFSRGFDGTTEYGLYGDWNNPPYDTLFIARTGVNTYETGWYNGSTRTVLVTRTPTVANDADVIGFYADVRATGINGNADNLAIVSYPYNPSETQVQDLDAVDVTLHWSAATDPLGIDAVDPDIANQYVFVSGDNIASDPNLYYVGATGDPGTTDPSSSLTVQDLLNDTTYNWAVVSAFDGYTQTLKSTNTLDDVDPNNIIGPTWSFTTLAASPVLVTNPSDNRLNAGGTATYKVEFTSATTPTIQWYKKGIGGDPNAPKNNGDDSGDITVIGPTYDDPNAFYYSILEIADIEDGDQGQYYCMVDNDSDDPAIASGYGLLVTNRLLAQYDFDASLAPAAGSQADAPTGQGKSIAGLAEPNSLQASNVALAFDEGVDGTANGAVKLVDPNQYVDFGITGYPKVADFTTNGVGNGLDSGSIICWVKTTANKQESVFGDFNTGSGTGLLLSLAPNAGTADARIVIRGDSAVYTEIGTVQGRSDRPAWDMFDNTWHLIAATWTAGDSLTLYVDGQQAASVAAGTPDGYLPWQRGVLLGASRQGTRYLLSDLFGGLVDNLRIYNYEIDADTIAQEYLDNTGTHPCINGAFAGSYYNTDNTGSSYCKVDLADFADFAETWLASGLY